MNAAIDLLLEMGCFYVVRAEELQRRELGQPVELSSAREAEKRWRYS
jgi:hypothetical protein